MTSQKSVCEGGYSYLTKSYHYSYGMQASKNLRNIMLPTIFEEGGGGGGKQNPEN